jgi:hypothetical protein
MMTNARQQGPLEGLMEGISPVTVSAGILILTGVVFQLAELGYAHLRGDGLWFFSVLGSNIWNMLALGFNAPAIQRLLQYWPLLLVGAGLAMLLAKQQSYRSSTALRRPGDADGE